MFKNFLKIEFSWCDENYGFVYVVVVFCNYVGIFDWSECIYQWFCGCLKCVGFEFYYGCCFYIVKRGEGIECQCVFCDELVCVGFYIDSGDVCVVIVSE